MDLKGQRFSNVFFRLEVQYSIFLMLKKRADDLPGRSEKGALIFV